MSKPIDAETLYGEINDVEAEIKKELASLQDLKMTTYMMKQTLAVLINLVGQREALQALLAYVE